MTSKNRVRVRSGPMPSKLSRGVPNVSTIECPCLVSMRAASREDSRKEVIQPQVLLQLPCYDFTPITDHTLGGFLPCGLAQPTSGTTDFRDVTGGVYKARERIHRGVLIRDY